MTTGTHTIEILINGERLDIYSQEKLNLRINNVVFDPVQVNNKTGEYSFSFTLPATPKNNRIFNYANNSSKQGKFTLVQNCEVVADGMVIFNGILRLSETSTKEYKCNLVNVKINNIEDIFGDMKMDEIEWEIPFEGTSTIRDLDGVTPSQPDVYFPLVAYGIFPKYPYASYNNGDINYYTDILEIDEYNKWYWESFKPSMQLTSLVRRYFASKGYEVSGEFFDDDVTARIFLSTNITDDQDPHLNLGNPNIGKLSLSGYYNNYGTYNSGTYRGNAPRVTQTLSFPKQQVYYNDSVAVDDYNFDTVFIYDILGTPYKSDAIPYKHTKSSGTTNQYMYRYFDKDNKDGGGYIYIPSTGLYYIRLKIDNLSYSTEGANLTYQKKNGAWSREQGYYAEESTVTSPKSWGICPVEIHLLRNGYETELIGTADPLAGVGFTNDIPPEKDYVQYPHEPDYTKYKTSSRGTTSGGGSGGGTSTEGGHNYGGQRAPSFGGSRNQATTAEEYYFQVMSGTIAYDPWVNPNFICGLTTINKSAAAMKNGGSWNPNCSDYNQCHWNCGGYSRYDVEAKNVTYTDYHQQTLLNAQGSLTETSTKNKNGVIEVVMELNAGDTISLYMVTKMLKQLERSYTEGGRTHGTTLDNDYMLSFNYTIDIEPYTPDVDKYVGSTYMVNKQPTNEELEMGWGKNLKLNQWLNQEEKVSDFINNVIKTFNLHYTVEDNIVRLDFGKNDSSGLAYVDIDDRVNTDDAKFSRIDYPSYMEVKWTIAEDEAGAYRSIPTVQQQGASNWKEYIDRGSERIVMDLTDTTNAQTVESKFSYNWFQEFRKSVDLQSVNVGESFERINIPLIAKDENFIIYTDDAVAKDGLGLKQRFWFKGTFTRLFTLWNDEKVSVRLPERHFFDSNGKRWVVSFKEEDGSLLEKYFNISPMLDSNFAEVECYLTPQEYIRLKSGSLVKFDSDLYYVSEISGYDPVSVNRTTLKLIKKTK